MDSVAVYLGSLIGWLMALLFLQIPLQVITGGGMIYAFKKGLRAWKKSHHYQGEYKKTLRFLALNLCEPLVNSFIISCLFMIMLEAGTPLPGISLAITLPMAVLLLPARGRHFSNPTYSRINIALLFFGLMRWILTALTLCEFLPISALTFFMGILVLWMSALWGASQLKGALMFPSGQASSAQRPKSTHRQPGPTHPAPSVATRPATVPAMVPAMSMAGASMPVAPHPPVHTPRAASPLPLPPVIPPPSVEWKKAVKHVSSILCPVCHTPTRSDATDCEACGLVFASRVPAALDALPDYQVIRPLGSGGMSTVYLARKRYSDRLCVIKTLATVDTITDPAWRIEAARCLRQEADLLQQLEHPHIARMLYWVSSEHCEFMVLEYIPGLTLEQRLSRSDGNGSTFVGEALSPAEALAYGCTVADVLCYLSRLPQPVVHHDIKPANLIVQAGDNKLVLVDFGGALLLPDTIAQTVRLDCYGTPGYAAPEQYHGQSTPRSDVYGLAATVYHLLTDDDPTNHPLEFPALASLPADVTQVLQPALATDPAARPEAWQFHRALYTVWQRYA